MSGNFSLELNEDQIQLQKWVHDFAEDVIRPAAEEWDEKEEFPWPVVEEAAKIGLYGFDFMANAMLADQSGKEDRRRLLEGFPVCGLAVIDFETPLAGIAQSSGRLRAFLKPGDI